MRKNFMEKKFPRTTTSRGLEQVNHSWYAKYIKDKNRIIGKEVHHEN